MTNESHTTNDSSSVEMPKPTAAPLVLAVGIVLAAMGVATSLAFLFVGVVVFVAGLGMWISQLLPGRGHWREPRVEPSLRPQPIVPAPGEVERLRHGMPGYRLRLPVKVHPVSAGIKGGIVGGLVMPLPALAYGLLSGHGIWWPVNLLAGMVLPGVGSMSADELEQFHPTLFVLGIRHSHRRVADPWPDLWRPDADAAQYSQAAGLGSAADAAAVDRRELRCAQRCESGHPRGYRVALVRDVAAGLRRRGCGCLHALEKRGAILAGLLGGAAGGLLMPIPAILWSLAAGHGIWYPVNLLAAMATHYRRSTDGSRIGTVSCHWFVAAVAIHVILSLSFRLGVRACPAASAGDSRPASPGAVCLMPLLWTALSYGMMGVVNPVLQERVDWPWFVVSQFVFGIVAAIVVVRSEEVYIPPAGERPDQRAEFCRKLGEHEVRDRVLPSLHKPCSISIRVCRLLAALPRF